jgi:hypothetical protein
VVALRDETLPSVVIGLDRALRRLDGVPTYALFEYVPAQKTDNEKTVTVDHGPCRCTAADARARNARLRGRATTRAGNA